MTSIHRATRVSVERNFARRQALFANFQKLEFHLDATTSTIEVWIDGVAKPELTVSRTSHGGTQVDLVFPTIDKAWFGWWLYQANPTPAAFEVWLDDLALGATRLGCD